MERLLKLRRKIKAKKPDFVRQDSHKKGEIKPRWRRPKGLQSKMRLKKKGYRKMPNHGYRSPKAVRGFDRSGLVPVLITSLKMIETVSKDTQGIVLSSNMGGKKKLEAVKIAKEKGVTILNVKDADKYITKIEEAMKKKKELKQKKEEKRAKDKKKKEEKKDKATKEEKPEKEEGLKGMINEEEQKIKEKKDKDKELIKKELQ